ncbi:hypothetical protein DRE_00394 [Drechslerella stenobrocha 248]|uniref:BRCT domain-containing protein n=1 Tax=Drechslerella stenobrocha 248 TaxID=1043628 RepID=W7HTH2_9PEZI|nr:hypothetical protein DRE_00394 [Drechslerella stenobrocha 248]
MEAATQDHSLDFENLKGLLAPSKGQVESPNARGRRAISSDDTQLVEDYTDGDCDSTVPVERSRASSPVAPLLANGFGFSAIHQFSPGQNYDFETDTQLPNTVLTGDHHSIRLDYSPDKFGSQNCHGDETQKDPDSYNERMKDNVASASQLSKKSQSAVGSDPIPDSQSQHLEPVYFDERKRFSNIGLLIKGQGDGSDEDEEIIRPVLANSPPMGLTQMFEATSPPRPPTDSSAMLTSPHLDPLSPGTPRKSPNARHNRGGLANRYISVEESQAERERRQRRMSYPEEDDGFGRDPPEIVRRVREQQREKDSAEQFKDISVARPQPRTPQPGKRGRPPKHRTLEPLLPQSNLGSEQPSEGAPFEDQDPLFEVESTPDDVELEVPGTMEPVVTEVKKTQSSQYRPSALQSSNVQHPTCSSQTEAIADSQPQAIAAASAKSNIMTNLEDKPKDIPAVLSSFSNQGRTRQQYRESAGTESPGRSLSQEMPPSSPPIRQSNGQEGPASETDIDTPGLTRGKAHTSSRILNALEVAKTPLTAKKIPLRLPSTIPATSPYNRDNVLSHSETPIPTKKRKRLGNSGALGVFGSASLASKHGIGLVAPSNYHQPEEVNEGLPQSKRPRQNSTRGGSSSPRKIVGTAVDHPHSNNEPVQTEPAGVGSPMDLNERYSSTEPDITAELLESPKPIVDTATPQKAIIPFRPTTSERRELSTVGPFRVFAEWDRAYYPAVVPELSRSSEGAGMSTQFAGAEVNVRADRMKRLELNFGESVKVSGQRQKVWIVQEVYLSASSVESQAKTATQLEREGMLDIYGNNMVKLKHKASETILHTHIGNICLSAAQFNALKAATVEVEYSLLSNENTPLLKREGSLLETPSKLARRNTPNTLFSNTQKLKPLKLTSNSRPRQAIFVGMRFTISLTGEYVQERDSLKSMLEDHGGLVLEGGFDELFQPVNSDATELVQRQGLEEIGFTAVISDRARTTSKFLQALALGIPCLAIKWVLDSVKEKKALAWQHYLLPAGESQYLEGVVKSRVIEWIDISSATFATMFSRRINLMEDVNIIIHRGTGRTKGQSQIYTFLILAMGPAHVHHATSVEEINKLLKAKSPVTRWHFVFSREDKKKFYLKGKVRDHMSSAPVKIVGDEWLKQSLIFGKLLDEEARW